MHEHCQACRWTGVAHAFECCGHASSRFAAKETIAVHVSWLSTGLESSEGMVDPPVACNRSVVSRRKNSMRCLLRFWSTLASYTLNRYNALWVNEAFNHYIHSITERALSIHKASLVKCFLVFNRLTFLFALTDPTQSLVASKPTNRFQSGQMIVSEVRTTKISNWFFKQKNSPSGCHLLKKRLLLNL